jgi:hypothetical protein
MQGRLTAGALELHELSLDSHFWNVGLNMPEVDSFLIEQYPQYKASAIMTGLFGVSTPTAAETFSWFELPRYRMGGIVDGIVGGNASLANPLVIQFALTNPMSQYVRLNMTLLAFNGRTANSLFHYPLKVRAITTVGPNVHVSLVTNNGAPLANINDYITVNTYVSEGWTESGEAGTIGVGQWNTPVGRTNNMTTIRRTLQLTPQTMMRKTLFGSPGEAQFWAYEAERQFMDNFMYDKELAMLFGRRSTNGVNTLAPGTANAYIAGDGLLPLMEDGSGLFTYSGSLTEADIQTALMEQSIVSPVKEWVALCGAGFMADFNRISKEYIIQGGYKSWDGPDSVRNLLIGLGATAYRFGQYVLHVIQYDIWNDPVQFPQLSGGLDMRNFAICLNLPGSSNRPTSADLKNAGIICRHFESNGLSRKMVWKYHPGAMVNGGSRFSGGSIAHDSMIASTIDQDIITVLDEFGLEGKVMQRHFLLAKVS